MLAHELDRRYGSDFDIHCEADLADAQGVLSDHPPDEVAIVIVDHTLAVRGGIEFLSLCSSLCPRAKRLISVVPGDRDAFDVLSASIALGRADYMIRKPMKEGDERFHRVIAEMIDEWATVGGHYAIAVHVVAPQSSARAHEMRDLLQRNGVPYDYLPSDGPEAKALLESRGVAPTDLPVLVLWNGPVLVDPSNAEAADALGASVKPDTKLYDVVVVGGGPAGLAAAVYASSEGLSTLVLEREAIGGQAGTSSRIRNYLGFPHGVTGVDLSQRAYEQAWLFGTDFCFMQDATVLRPCEEGYEILTRTGDRVRARTVILSTGVSYRRIGVEALDRLVGMGVFYGAAASEAAAVSGGHAFVVGGGNSAGQAAVHLSGFASQVTVLVRGRSLAASMSDYLIRELDLRPNIHVRYDCEVVDGGGTGRLERVAVKDRSDGSISEVPCDGLFVMIGAQPHLDWLPAAVARDDWGYIVTGRDLDLPAAGWREQREPYHLETSLPGVFAVGDIRHRSIKRVASAVGEGSAAIQSVHQYLEDEALRAASRQADVRPSATRSASPA